MEKMLLMLMFPSYVKGLEDNEYPYLKDEHITYYRNCINTVNEFLSKGNNDELLKLIRRNGKAHSRLNGTTDYAYSGLLYQLFEFQPFVKILDTTMNSGVVDVTIKFKSSGLEAGDTVVVIENIYDMSTEEEIAQGIQTEDVRVISHEDLNNKDQSLAVTNLPISGELLSGESVWGFVVFFISIGAGAVAITIEVKRKRIKRTRRW